MPSNSQVSRYQWSCRLPNSIPSVGEGSIEGTCTRGATAAPFPECRRCRGAWPSGIASLGPFLGVVVRRVTVTRLPQPHHVQCREEGCVAQRCDRAEENEV